MFLIQLQYHSDVKGVYTKEEETAADWEQCEKKLNRTAKRWAKIIIPDMSDSEIEGNSRGELFRIIIEKINTFNDMFPGEQHREFDIYCTEE
jgi:hypothetical protein